ncbi:UNVERIFIED_CONTAM: hypothetical protein H355_014776 [Colinus virginianus]|nr:hypothetical protein H355_014776 [Colinus virginianus]
MSLQWTVVAMFLYAEVFLVLLLCLPFVSPTRWQKIFKSCLVGLVLAYGNTAFVVLIVILVLLLLGEGEGLMWEYDQLLEQHARLQVFQVAACVEEAHTAFAVLGAVEGRSADALLALEAMKNVVSSWNLAEVSKPAAILPKTNLDLPLLKRKVDQNLPGMPIEVIVGAVQLATVCKIVSHKRCEAKLFNLSEKRHDLIRLHPTVQEFGWPDLLAPPLDTLCAICKALERCLRALPPRVAVLHCRGNRGKVGVVVAAYMHYSRVCARYIAHFGALLSGATRVNSRPVFLHHVLLPPLPRFQPDFRPFLKLYQALQLVHTSGVYAPGPQSVCISLEPALLLKGDVLVQCYQRWGSGRRAVFRAQFHTCALQGERLRLCKEELDLACEGGAQWDERFPPDAAVEFVFSSSPDKVEGWASPCGTVCVDLCTWDPTVRRDSFHGFNARHQDSSDAVALLKDREPGAFLVRDSTSFRGGYGLALRVAQPPPGCPPAGKGDPRECLVRHFLIETGPRGVKIRGGAEEPHFERCVPLISPRIFGFVAKQAGGAGGNACHLFAELDPEQPARAIVSFVTKVMLRRTLPERPLQGTAP